MFILIFTLIFNASAATSDGFRLSVDAYLNGGPIVVPPGNTSNGESKSYSSSKYNSIVRLISKAKNICIIKQAAELYAIDPVIIMGSIVGEHTYNVSAWDIGQDNYAYMRSRWVSRFENNGVDLAEMLQEPNYKKCEAETSNNFDLWNCYNAVWKNDPNGDGKDQLKWYFFNPMGSGYTYGFGQLGPERALMVTDYVHQVSGFDELTLADPPALYDAILNPQISIHYVAATNRIAIEVYKQIANFDISQNPGIVATLYNLGREVRRANSLYERTVKNLTESGESTFPAVNPYGWLINEKEAELRSVYEEAILNCP